MRSTDIGKTNFFTLSSHLISYFFSRPINFPPITLLSVGILRQPVRESKRLGGAVRKLESGPDRRIDAPRGTNRRRRCCPSGHAARQRAPIHSGDRRRARRVSHHGPRPVGGNFWRRESRKPTCAGFADGPRPAVRSGRINSPGRGRNVLTAG